MTNSVGLSKGKFIFDEDGMFTENVQIFDDDDSV
jgi:hypothetical protein